MKTIRDFKGRLYREIERHDGYILAEEIGAPVKTIIKVPQTSQIIGWGV